MPLTTPKVAFVTGANGISGNAIIEHLIRQSRVEWSKIIITSRSQLKYFWQDYRVEFIALDFLQPAEELVTKMGELCQDVTHAFFTSYVHSDDFTKLPELNVPLFSNFLTAIDTVASKNLQRICLQTGGKHHGAHLGPIECPLNEEMPRYEDYGENFYYPQEDFLFEMASKRSWTWNVIRPHAIIGFTPAQNGMSEALTLALYILVCKELGIIPKFPGNKFFYNAVDDNSYAPSLADMSVWAATTEHAQNEAFTHVNGDVFVWRYFWPKIGRYFGVEIPDMADTDFNEDGENGLMAHNMRLNEWAKDKQSVWERVVQKYGGNPDAFAWGTWSFFDWCLGKAWPTVGTVSKARKFGWQRYDNTYETWIETFRAFENAGTLPSRRALKVKEVPRPTKLPNPAEAVVERKKRIGEL